MVTVSLQIIFAAARIMLSLAFLVYASWSDYKTREVSNRVWVVYAPLAILLSITELLMYDLSKLPFFGLSFGVTAVFAILLFYTGGFGGADSKALMCIALALPFYPEALFTPIFASGVSPLAQTIFPLTIFSNSVLLAAASGVYMLLRNIVRRAATGKKMFEDSLATQSVGKKILVMITGYKVPVAKLKEKWHIYPLEDIENESESSPKRKLVIVPKDQGRNEIVERLSNAVNTGKITNQIWATPGLPLLIFITIGLIIAILFGDLVWMFISFVLG
jgi:archaeal preflagellin peptidase FlaK